MISYVHIAEALKPWFCRHLGVKDVEISDVSRHTEGWSWHTYTMTVFWIDPSTKETIKQGFVVRREPEEGLIGHYDAQEQFDVHRAVIEYSEVPMPKLHWLEMDPSVLGNPFYVMDKVEGVVPVQWRGKDTTIFPSDDVRHDIGINFVEMLTKIHSIDYRGAGLEFLGAPNSSDDSAIREITRWEALYENSFLMEVPYLRQVIGWLRNNIATSGRVGLCHGDYRIGNFMLKNNRIVAVFDWELSHIGDPVEDIAWSGLPLFRGRSPLLSQLLAKDEFFYRYKELTGLQIEEEVFYFWTVFGHLKAAAPHLRACRIFEEKKATDLRLAVMGHQMLYILRQLSETLGFK